MDAKTEVHEYRKGAFMRAIKRTPGLVLNDGIDYANILIHSMIGLCQPDDEVCIYTGSLPRDSYDVALQLTPARHINIVLDDDSKIGWLASLPQSVLNRIDLYKINRQYPKHFFFTSSGAYRLENDANEFKAEADFNNLEAISTFSNVFPKYLEDSTKITKPVHKPEFDADTSGT